MLQVLARETLGYTGVLNFVKHKLEAFGWILKDSQFIDEENIKVYCAETNTLLSSECKKRDKNVFIKFKHSNNSKTKIRSVNIQLEGVTIFQIPFEPKQAISTYLSPEDLTVTSSIIKNVLLIGPCTIAATRCSFSQRFKQTKFTHYNANNFAKVIVDDKKYDVKIISITPYQLMGMVNETKKFLEPNFWNDLYEDSIQKLSLMLDNYISDSGVLTLVCNFITPQSPPEISLQRGREARKFLMRLNFFIEEYIVKFKNTFMLDLDIITSSIGKMWCTGEHIHPPLLTKMFYTDGMRGKERYPEFKAPERDRIDDYLGVQSIYETKLDDYYDALFREINSLYRISKQLDQVKLVVFDIDDTLINGRIVDHYDAVYESKSEQAMPERTRWNAGLWQAIQYLRGRGILISLISKNDEDVVKKWFNKLSGSNIQYTHFINPKINWRPKNENMSELLQDFNLTPKSVVFVDDNPTERDNIKTFFPEIRTIGSSPYELKRVLNWSPETQTPYLTLEAQNKDKLILHTVKRTRKLRTSPNNRDSFIKELKIKTFVHILSIENESAMRRCFELTNKTNQFNTTGKRWEYLDFVSFLKRKETNVFYFEVEDKNINHGIVGVVYTDKSEITQFVMSCRVIGIDVEKYVLNEIEKLLYKRYPHVTGIILETSNNLPCRQLFLDCKYKETHKNIFRKNR